MFSKPGEFRFRNMFHFLYLYMIGHFDFVSDVFCYGVLQAADQGKLITEAVEVAFPVS